jgi:hypothetical protein
MRLRRCDRRRPEQGLPPRELVRVREHDMVRARLTRSQFVCR